MGQSLGEGTLEHYGQQAEHRRRGSLRISPPADLLVSRGLRGAYDLDGNLVEHTRRKWAIEGGLPDPGLPLSLPRRDIAHVNEDAVVWGGGLIHAYGHFLTESVARLWPLLPGGRLEDRPVVWTTPKPTPFIREWCEAFGLRTVELPWDGVVRFTNMFVPEPAWRLNAWIAPEIRDIHLHAREGLDVPPVSESKVLWLSRSGLVRGRLAYDEALLEWLLREHITIVRPETLSLGEQIAVVERSRATAGIVGSAFHTMLMMKRPPTCVLLCAGHVRAAYVDQDRLLKQGATFVHGLATVEATPSRRLRFPVKFPRGYRVLIPETLRALSRTILPELLDDSDLRILAMPESLSSRVRNPSARDKLMTAIARVLLDPMWMHGRMRLGQRLEEEGLNQCAAEQYMMVSELSDDYAARASHYAARNLARMERPDEASEMAKQALSLDSRQKETAAVVYITQED